MKKIIVFVVFVIIIVSVIGVKYYSYRVDYIETNKENSEYEEYKDKEIYGIELASLINKTADKNIQNKVEINEKGEFVPNEENSIQIDIYILDNETKYKMEAFYNNGTEQFAQYYNDVKFKCSKIQYHEKTNKIKYILFEQIPIS